VNPFVFQALNGYPPGQKYDGLVVRRRLDTRQARASRRPYRGRVFVARAVVALSLTAPALDLAAPVTTTAFMLHPFENMRQPAMRS